MDGLGNAYMQEIIIRRCTERLLLSPYTLTRAEALVDEIESAVKARYTADISTGEAPAIKQLWERANTKGGHYYAIVADVCNWRG